MDFFYEKILVMFTGDAIFSIVISIPVGQTVEQEARIHGEFDPHILKIEDIFGKLLWERTLQ